MTPSRNNQGSLGQVVDELSAGLERCGGRVSVRCHTKGLGSTQAMFVGSVQKIFRNNC